jgi:hypothetical protein
MITIPALASSAWFRARARASSIGFRLNPTYTTPTGIRLNTSGTAKSISGPRCEAGRALELAPDQRQVVVRRDASGVIHHDHVGHVGVSHDVLDQEVQRGLVLGGQGGLGAGRQAGGDRETAFGHLLGERPLLLVEQDGRHQGDGRDDEHGDDQAQLDLQRQADACRRDCACRLRVRHSASSRDPIGMGSVQGRLQRTTEVDRTVNHRVAPA